MARSTCPRPDKNAHRSRPAADLELLNLWLKVEDIDERLRLHSYKCVPGCGMWHVGRRPKNGKNSAE